MVGIASAIMLRWAHTHLDAIERALAQLRVRGAGDAGQVHRAGDRLGSGRGRLT